MCIWRWSTITVTCCFEFHVMGPHEQYLYIRLCKTTHIYTYMYIYVRVVQTDNYLSYGFGALGASESKRPSFLMNNWVWCKRNKNVRCDLGFSVARSKHNTCIYIYSWLRQQSFCGVSIDYFCCLGLRRRNKQQWNAYTCLPGARESLLSVSFWDRFRCWGPRAGKVFC